VTTVVVVDDHPVVLAGLTAMFEAAEDLDPVGAAGSVAEAMALDLAEPPDVCVVDLRLPDGDGITLATRLKERWPGTRTLVLTMDSDPSSVIRGLGHGIDGYLLKDSDPGELLSAVRAAAAGTLVLGRGASAHVAAAAAALPPTEPLAALDARDREILGLLVEGLSVSQTAARLFLAPKTIRNRISEMIAKLGVETRDEAVAIGRAGGLGSCH
jgi:DNA-binding NarL/FixJ family response regulator